MFILKPLLYLCCFLVSVTTPPNDEIHENAGCCESDCNATSKDLTDPYVQHAIISACYELSDRPTVSITSSQINSLPIEVQNFDLQSTIKKARFKPVREKLGIIVAILSLWDLWYKCGLVQEMMENAEQIIRFIYQSSHLMVSKYEDFGTNLPTDELISLLFYFCKFVQNLTDSPQLKARQQTLSSILTNIVDCLLGRKNFEASRLAHALNAMRELGILYLVKPGTVENIQNITLDDSEMDITYLEHLRLIYRYGKSPFQDSDSSLVFPRISTAKLEYILKFLQKSIATDGLTLPNAVLIHFLLMSGYLYDKVIKLVNGLTNSPTVLYDDIKIHVAEIRLAKPKLDDEITINDDEEEEEEWEIVEPLASGKQKSVSTLRKFYDKVTKKFWKV